ncbi:MULTISPECIES: CDGSH iron-sulfur domain-containing protein [Brevibacterium]|jgi:CDGSH-type Zn-finger protein|nr:MULTISPECIES: CDGSH iron-sulfur domain-containing protein [Brevibacterium]MCM1013487.1 CDGSH iron-sulfur domain-containing protein [Brevibacterium sp. XM4083]MCT1446151.1 CDGSH iron-sulfur domain-containing protein [Brevibacterium casei]MCT1764997.1 CDGSH iron-sulfur domain-containing protein [Brevibacterium casei]MCT2182533.1 CDGSH iron-sulfur domain-containing protein [Brevibacterium casei]MDH5149869.1 CDGSH iron-sulfur domain-containing protein [Brevibacterium casei]
MSMTPGSEGSTPPTAIKVVDDGPLQVKGTFQVTDGGGGIYEVQHRAVFLCRCGHSAAKPFCDGSHKRHGFTDAGRAEDHGEKD